MPIYTYRCEACGLQFDKYQTFAEDPLVRCPECKKKALKKVFQPVGIVFKGSGFYKTDYRSESYKKAARAEDPGHGGSTGGEKKKKDD